MKPTITVDKTQAPTIRMNTGARNAIVPVRSNPYLANRQAEIIKIPASERVANVASAIGSMMPSLGLSIQGGNKTDNRAYADNRQDNRTYNDNRTANDNRTYNDNRQEVTAYTQNHLHGDVVENNYTEINDSHNQSYSVQSYESTSYQFADNSTHNTHIDNSQHWTDNSQHLTNIYNDNSQHYTDNSQHISASFTSTGQSFLFSLFFGDGLEKVLMALTMLAIVTVIFLTEMLMIVGGLAAFIIAYKTAKFAWQRSEAEKTRAHQLELAKLTQPVHNHFHVDAQVFAQVAAQVGVNIPQTAALPEPAYFQADAPTAVKPNKVKEMVTADMRNAKEQYGKAAQAFGGKAKQVAGKAKEAAKREAKRQGNLFIDGMKHEVLGMKKGTK
jgi:hypothetical protein